ncbi:MAG: hypothetical protein WC985_00990 [Thermoplasmata archaeon]
MDRDVFEDVAHDLGVEPDPSSLAAVLRAHVECERERERLMKSLEIAALDVLNLRREHRDLQGRYDTLIRENAGLIARSRRLEETLAEHRRSGQRG